MNTGPDGIELMHYYEQCKLLAYPDPGSELYAALKAAGIDPYNVPTVPTKFAHMSGAPWSIAYGDTGPDVVPGLRLTQAEADGRFAKRLAQEFEPGVTTMLKIVVAQRQFDALVSLAYNIGVDALRKSTLMSCLNRRQPSTASAQFLVWNKSGGKVSLGLRRRRAAEQAVFDGQSARFGIALAAAIR